jgi:hypothetical protein
MWMTAVYIVDEDVHKGDTGAQTTEFLRTMMLQRPEDVRKLHRHYI